MLGKIQCASVCKCAKNVFVQYIGGRCQHSGDDASQTFANKIDVFAALNRQYGDGEDCAVCRATQLCDKAVATV